MKKFLFRIFIQCYRIQRFSEKKFFRLVRWCGFRRVRKTLVLNKFLLFNGSVCFLFLFRLQFN